MTTENRGLTLGTNVRILTGTFRGMLVTIAGYHTEVDKSNLTSLAVGRWSDQVEIPMGNAQFYIQKWLNPSRFDRVRAGRVATSPGHFRLSWRRRLSRQDLNG